MNMETVGGPAPAPVPVDSARLAELHQGERLGFDVAFEFLNFWIFEFWNFH